MDISVVIEYILSMKWLWLVVIIMLYDLAKKIINTYARNIALKSDVIIRDTQYKEEDIIKHLDYIIKETLDEYIVFNIRPKQIYYINNKMEKQIIDYLSEEIPKRLSKTLLTHLSFIYNSDYVGEFIGRHIYMIVLEYVLDYNITEANEK